MTMHLAATLYRTKPGAVWLGWASQRLPGVALCAGVTLLATGLPSLERRLFGQVWLEPLVLAIVAGAAVRTLWTPGERWREGVEFSAKTLLEFAVVLLGASVSARTLFAARPALLLGIVGVVMAAIAASYGLGRCLGLRRRMAVLVACGTSICGNSAIAAVAPVIGADGEEVSAAIAFTAILGVVAVFSLPLLGIALGLHPLSYGAFAGLTVYAVPQVLAAAAPAGVAAVRFGTLVKLVRVLMLGPVCLTLSFLARRLRNEAADGALQVEAGSPPTPGRFTGHKLVPWFILGFLAMAALRSLDALPAVILSPTAGLASMLTVLSMAALGLSTDVRGAVMGGARVTLAVIGSLLVLGAISLGLVHMLRLD